MSSLEVHGPEVVPALEALLFPEGAPPQLTVAGVLQALHAVLARNRDRLSAADLAHAAELADDEAPRAARDEGLAGLRTLLTSTRATIANNFGPAVLTAYGIPSPIPDAGDLLLRTATLIEDKLRTRPLVEPSLQPGVTVNPIAIANAIKEKLDAVSGALADVERERREAQLTLEAKTGALAEWSLVYPFVDAVTTSCYEVARRNDLADVVRPTARRRAGQTESTAEGDGTTKGGGGTGGTGTG
ncbi:MAG: hypothetical protein IT372_21930 [Polyangiaceae bacterium]|nr:hypothetical protein [Polyangiaceae bacterium]